MDREAPAALRAGTQGMITLVTYGAGMLQGAWLSGRVVENFSDVNSAGILRHDWRSIWWVGAACAGLVLVLFLSTFSQKKVLP